MNKTLLSLVILALSVLVYVCWNPMNIVQQFTVWLYIYYLIYGSVLLYVVMIFLIYKGFTHAFPFNAESYYILFKVGLIFSLMGAFSWVIRKPLKQEFLENQVLEYMSLFHNQKVSFAIPCFQNRSIYKNISENFLDQSEGAIHNAIAFYGPPGAGKTTFLKLFSRQNQGIIYYSLEQSDIDDLKPLQKFVDRFFLTTFWSPVSWFFTEVIMEMSEKPNFDSIKELFSSERFIQKLNKKIGKNPTFIFDNGNLLKDDHSNKTFKKIMDFMKFASDEEKFRVILSGSEGWTPTTLSQSFDPRRLSIIVLDPDFTKEEAKQFYKCYRKTDEFFEEAYEILKGNIAALKDFFTLFKGPETSENFNETIRTMINRMAGDFDKAKINFQDIITKSDDLELKEIEVKKILILFNKLIKEKDRLLLNEEVKQLLPKNMITLNVLKVYEEKGENYVDFQTHLHRAYVENELGMKDQRKFEKIRKAIYENYQNLTLMQ